MEAEETARFSNARKQTMYIARQRSVDPEDLYLPNFLDPNDWLFPSDFALSSGLLANLEIFKNIETSSDIRSNF